MLDVIHFFFEEDSRYVSGEEAEGVSALRTYMYRDLYGVTYQYASSKSQNNSLDFDDYSEFSNVTKPYVPPTEFNPGASNPFGSLLDAPIG